VLDATSTGRDVNWRAFAAEQITTAAAPLDTGHISKSRSGLLT